MTSISSLNSAALLNLQQSKTLSVSPSATVLSNADTVTMEKGVVDKSERSEAEATLDYWGVLSENAVKPELNLIEQLGTEFGIYQKDYDSINAYGEAIRIKVAEVRSQPLGFLTITEIENNLRLNDLGITLDTLIDIVSHPNGNAEEELSIALEKAADDQAIDNNAPGPIEAQDSVTIDENGVYSLLK